MAAIRRTDTKPEVALRSNLHMRGLRFRKDLRIDASGIKVRPDVVFPRMRVAVFVDGCFWHSCPQHGRAPTANVDYWGPKLQRNRERDARQNEALISAGWRVIRIWEHDGPEAATATVLDVLLPLYGAGGRTVPR